jgi:hypothetical protein
VIEKGHTGWLFISLKKDPPNDIFQSKVPISVFDEVNAIESTGVGVLGLNSYCVELVLRSVGDQHVSEATISNCRSFNTYLFVSDRILPAATVRTIE